MALLPIIVAPDPRLKKVSTPVDSVDAELCKLMDDMLETMYAAPGIGLAAPQVGILKRVIVVDIGEGEGDEKKPAPIRMANPEILWLSDGQATFEEGCLSLPDQFQDVTRPEGARIRFIDQDNEIREIEVEGLLATCIQHEIDHLEGILFVDHLTLLKRGMILRKLAKAKKVQAPAPAPV